MARRRRFLPAEPVGMRNPAILYGVGNILENAVDFARELVEVNAWWNDELVELVISDDGPGIAPDILKRIGEPYLTRRPANDEAPGDHGLGLGVFIARTLLERTGAKVSFSNRVFPDHGAVATIVWPRTSFETAAIENPSSIRSCAADSSPEAYRTRPGAPVALATAPQMASTRVDLPMPGSPATSTTFA